MFLSSCRVVRSNRGDIFGGAREGGQTALSRCGCLRTSIYYYPVLYYFTCFYFQNHSMSTRLIANDIFIFLQTFLNTFFYVILLIFFLCF